MRRETLRSERTQISANAAGRILRGALDRSLRGQKVEYTPNRAIMSKISLAQPTCCNQQMGYGIFLKALALNEKSMKSLMRSRLLVLFTFIIAVPFAVNAQVDIARKTTAITYPLDETVTVPFRGTTRFPRMKGSATVKRT